MSSIRSGLPTPTENWDDDFDFDPSPLPPASSTSSRTTSSSHPKLLDIVQHDEDLAGRTQNAKAGNQPRVVESWDDDFDYDPLDWTKSVKGLPGTDSGDGFPSPYATTRHGKASTDASQTIILSQPLSAQSASSSISDKTTSRAPNSGAAHQRSFSSMVSQSTAQSGRRDRKRSFRFPSQASSSSLNVDQYSQHLVPGSSTLPSQTYPDLRGKSFDISRESLDSRATSTRKLRKGRLPDEEVKEGAFMKRVASVRRRISGSLSTGPSKVVHPTKSNTSDDMPPPPVPSSAFRTASLANALPPVDTTVTGLPRMSSGQHRNPPSGQRGLGPTSSRLPSQREKDTVQGLPTSTRRSKRESLDAQPQSRSISGVMSSESGSSYPVSCSSESMTDLAGEGRAISPTSPPGMYSASSFSSPSPSITSLASHAGGYGFHLPSPAAGSAYNVFGTAHDTSAQRQQVSDSSTRSDYGTTQTTPDNCTAGVGATTSSAHTEQRTPKANRISEMHPDGTADCPPLVNHSPPAFSPLAEQIRGARPMPQVFSPLPSALKAPNITPRINNIENRTTGDYHPADMVELTTPNQSIDAPPPSKTDERALTDFRFGSKTSNPSSSSALPGLPESSRRRPSDSPLATETSNQGTTGKARLTLRRIGSISRRHSRKISDGWRAVSGHSSSPLKSSTPIVECGNQLGVSTASRESNASRHSVVPIIQHSAASKPGIPTAPSSLVPASPASPLPAFQTFGKGTSTPPRPVLLSPTRPSPMSHSTSTPSAVQLTPTAMRSLSQNDSPSTLKVGISIGELANESNGGGRPASHQRRNSLGDLKIPSRVVSAQKGLKEEIGAMKQFAAGVQDLKALMAQRTILQAKQERLGINDTSLESEYSQWWSLADLLIQLGETGSLDGNSGGGMLGLENNNDIRRERRITLAAETVLPPSHLSRLANDVGMSTASVAEESRSSLSKSTDFAMAPSAPGKGRISSLWRASTGRTDFSSAQLEQLRVILDKPRASALATIADNSAQMKTISLPLVETEKGIPRDMVEAADAGLVEGLPRSKTARQASQLSLGLGASNSKHNPLAAEPRKSSRSTMGTIRDFWRGTGGSQRLGYADTPRVASSKQPRRPSLGSLLRRSSHKMPSPLQVQSYDGSPNDLDDPKEPTSNASQSTAAPDDDNQTSSVSDWDTPPPETKPSGRSGTGAGQRSAELSIAVNQPLGDDITITRSDSRKMLAALGRGHSLSVEGKTLTLSPIRPEFQIPAFSTSPQEVSQLELAERVPLALTPASLPALVDKVKDVTEHCRIHLDTASKRLKSQAAEVV